MAENSIIAGDQIVIVWWNTGLAPQAISRAKPDEIQLAVALIDRFVSELLADLIVLCEVSEFEIQEIQQKCNLDGYELKNGIRRVGNLVFDTCYMVRLDKMQVMDVEDLIFDDGVTRQKTAQKLQIEFCSVDKPLYVLASHWPSRMHCPENDPKRMKLGNDLREKIRQIKSESSIEPYVLLIGDYNDEPFSSSISASLNATRDRSRVLRKPELLFNPFWRTFVSPNESPYSCGSYYYKSGTITRWHTFDQMMFSHSLIQSTGWRLDESAVGVIAIPEFVSVITEGNTKFDHLPIYCRIIKEK